MKYDKIYHMIYDIMYDMMYDMIYLLNCNWVTNRWQ